MDRGRGHRGEQSGLLLRHLRSRVVQEAAAPEQASGAVAHRAAELGDVFVARRRERVEDRPVERDDAILALNSMSEVRGVTLLEHCLLMNNGMSTLGDLTEVTTSPPKCPMTRLLPNTGET
jgi:hypothetical protein